jgi:hypothetical protein
MMLTRLADRLDRMRRSVLTIWISAFVVGMAGWGVAAVLAAVVFRAVGGLCP